MSFGAITFSGVNPFDSNRYTISMNTTTTTTAPVSFPAVNRIGCTSFNPTQLSNCALWFDAADTSTITGSSQVTGWVNKGSISVTAVNRTGSCSSGNRLANGLNYINCPAGTDMGFTCALNTQPRTWFLVARNLTQLTSSPNPQNYWAPVNQTAGNGQDSVGFFLDSANGYGGSIGPSGLFAALVTYQLTNPLNLVQIFSIVNSTSTSENVFAQNGTSLAKAADIAASSYNTASLTYTLNTGGYNTGGDLMEILFYTRAISPGERQQVEGYLAWKWGQQGSLPANHPYKLFPPNP